MLQSKIATGPPLVSFLNKQNRIQRNRLYSKNAVLFYFSNLIFIVLYWVFFLRELGRLSRRSCIENYQYCNGLFWTKVKIYLSWSQCYEITTNQRRHYRRHSHWSCLYFYSRLRRHWSPHCPMADCYGPGIRLRIQRGERPGRRLRSAMLVGN